MRVCLEGQTAATETVQFAQYAADQCALPLHQNDIVYLFKCKQVFVCVSPIMGLFVAHIRESECVCQRE